MFKRMKTTFPSLEITDFKEPEDLLSTLTIAITTTLTSLSSHSPAPKMPVLTGYFTAKAWQYVSTFPKIPEDIRLMNEQYWKTFDRKVHVHKGQQKVTIKIDMSSG